MIIENAEEYNFSTNLLEIKELSLRASEILAGGVKALGSGALVGVASYGGAMAFGTASTGTAISTLSGVAFGPVGAAIVAALYKEASKELRNQREEFENLIEEVLELKKEEFKTCFELVDQGLEASNPAKTIEGLIDVATILVKQLKFESFEEFDNYMSSTDDPLIL